MKVGPDGYLYVLSIYEGGADCYAENSTAVPCVGYTSGIGGTIFRTGPASSETN